MRSKKVFLLLWFALSIQYRHGIYAFIEIEVVPARQKIDPHKNNGV